MKTIVKALRKLNRGRRACAVSALCATAAMALPAQTFTTVYSFCVDSTCSDGDLPAAGLVQATDGNFYGTTPYGGAIGNGTVFKITPGGTLTTLHSFGQLDGRHPLTALVQATNGDFYGTTSDFGAEISSRGTIFEITPSGTLTTLYSCSYLDCSMPSALVQATDGNLYGTAIDGGYSAGTVFKITLTGTLTTLYTFCSGFRSGGCPDGLVGNVPPAPLIQASDGDLYGTTSSGGAQGFGTVFKITPSGALTTLYSFCAQTGCTDGAGPWAPLVQATDGNFYGTTSAGGANCATNGGCGKSSKLRQVAR